MKPMLEALARSTENLRRADAALRAQANQAPADPQR
jgi:hypothetical protein